MSTACISSFSRLNTYAYKHHQLIFLQNLLEDSKCGNPDEELCSCENDPEKSQAWVDAGHVDGGDTQQDGLYPG